MFYDDCVTRPRGAGAGGGEDISSSYTRSGLTVLMSCTASFTKEMFCFRIFFPPQLEVIHFLPDSCEKGTMFLWQLVSAVILLLVASHRVTESGRGDVECGMGPF